MKITTNSTNFYGYKNVLSTEIVGRNSELSFITAQLNDEGSPDLTEFKKAKKLLEQPIEEINSDVITILYTRSNNEKPNLFINNRVLFWGDELRWLKDNQPKAMSDKEYKSIEDAHMKIYTLFASLTKRMMNNDLCNSDSEIDKVVRGFMRNMTSFVKDDDASFELLQHAYSSKIPLKQTAARFNQIFMNTMMKFFK